MQLQTLGLLSLPNDAYYKYLHKYLDFF